MNRLIVSKAKSPWYPPGQRPADVLKHRPHPLTAWIQSLMRDSHFADWFHFRCSAGQSSWLISLTVSELTNNLANIWQFRCWSELQITCPLSIKIVKTVCVFLFKRNKYHYSILIHIISFHILYHNIINVSAIFIVSSVVIHVCCVVYLARTWPRLRATPPVAVSRIFIIPYSPVCCAIYIFDVPHICRLRFLSSNYSSNSTFRTKPDVRFVDRSTTTPP